MSDGAAALSARVKWPKECKKQRGCPKKKSHPTIKDVDGEVEEAARILVAMSRKAFADAAAAFGTGPRCPKGGKKERSKASSSSSSSGPHRPRRDQKNPMLLRRQQSEERIRLVVNGCYDIRLLTEKELRRTDVATRQNRLRFGCSNVPEFLTEEERRSLIKPREVRDYPAIRVRLMIEPSGEQSWISLKLWKIGRSPSYVLTNEWGKIVRKHEIVQRETLHILSFRWGDGKLGIALVRSPHEA